MSPIAIGQSRNRIAFLDLLRSAAIILVMLHHFRHLDGAPEWFKWFALRGHIGVDIFFVLSGWLVGGQLFRSLKQHGRVTTLSFWSRRAMRTWPLYYALLLCLWIGGNPDWSTSWSMVLFIQNYLCPHEWLITWSLCIEEQFYLMLPLILIGLLTLPRKLRWVFALLLVLLSPALRWASFGSLEAADYGAFLGDFYGRTHLRLDGLAIGTAAAALMEWKTPNWRIGKRHMMWILAIGFTFTMLAGWNPYWVGFGSNPLERMSFFCAVPQSLIISLGVALMIVAGVSVCQKSNTRWASVSYWISEHTYALYLTHLFAISLIRRFMPAGAFGFWGQLLIATAVAAILAASARWCIERPALSLRARLLPLSHAPVAAGRTPAMPSPR